MCAALVALEGMNFLDAMTFQDLCKLRAVSKDVKGSLCRSHWHWHSAATRALPDFDLTPALFLGAALQRCFQVMPLLLRLTSAQHYTMPRSVRSTTPQRVVLQDHKIAVRREADGLALAKRVEMQLQVAKALCQGLHCTDGKFHWGARKHHCFEGLPVDFLHPRCGTHTSRELCTLVCDVQERENLHGHP